MASKIQAAKISCAQAFTGDCIRKEKSVLARIVQGEEEGTLFCFRRTNKLKGRKRWDRFFSSPQRIVGGR